MAKVREWNEELKQYVDREETAEEAADRALTAQGAATLEAQSLTLKQQVVSLAQTAVGVAVNDLTAAQRNALVVVLLHKAGALTSDLKIKPLNQWV